MIRVLQDTSLNNLLNADSDQVLERYWSFSAYNGFCLNMSSTEHLSLEEEEAYIDDITFENSNLIDVGKFSKAVKILGMDEWTSLNSFISKPNQACEIHEFISQNDFNPSLIASKFPDIQLIGFYWGAKYWDVYGDIEKAYSMTNSDLLYVDTENSPFLSKECNEAKYSNAIDTLEQLLTDKTNKNG